MIIWIIIVLVFIITHIQQKFHSNNGYYEELNENYNITLMMSLKNSSLFLLYYQFDIIEMSINKFIYETITKVIIKHN